jgi:hypothetical protein
VGGGGVVWRGRGGSGRGMDGGGRRGREGECGGGEV